MEETFMQRALDLARQGWGRTNPNPLVGAVLVRSGQVVGEGYHPRRGQAHAEVEALRHAGGAARGATLYVNLEPCCHQGRTPPCVDSVIAAGVSRVVMAMLDPNPRVSGRGRAALEKAGIACTTGVLEGPARRLNEIFVHYITRKRPFVIMKTAMSLDGKVATVTGDSRWVTGPEARAHVHRWRDRVAAIAVGIGTALADDPGLTARPASGEGRDPVRVILDSQARLPPGARVLSQASAAPTLVAVTAKAPEERRQALREAGAQVLVLPEREGGVDPGELLRELYRRQLDSLLLEGGGKVNASFLRAGLVQKVMLYLAPSLVGGEDAPTPVEGPGVTCMRDALPVQNLSATWLGPDLLLEGYRDEEGDGIVYGSG